MKYSRSQITSAYTPSHSHRLIIWLENCKDISLNLIVFTFTWSSTASFCVSMTRAQQLTPPYTHLFSTGKIKCLSYLGCLEVPLLTHLCTTTKTISVALTPRGTDHQMEAAEQHLQPVVPVGLRGMVTLHWISYFISWLLATGKNSTSHFLPPAHLPGDVLRSCDKWLQ